ncbi:hypothetical protein [Sulfuracidifex tepidarius]|uniref:Uncharacterized protein n=1 Tax=Sulfuracidifex tepidarius TaxID=1294262 RepID=A0A510E457_9CREN|nr:hypothetical protein [Sulfuracidifex tepidarius]BBG27294.1 hypothetical protein IC007_1839 [Sulfuracidifex tepidarius]
MSETGESNSVDNKQETSSSNEAKVKDQIKSDIKRKATRDKLDKEKKRKADDSFIIILPEKVKSLRAKIENRVVEILKGEPLINEKELILKLIARDTEIKDYYVKTQDISYLQFVLWDMAKKKVIYKAKILGDRKHVYFFLPEQLEQIKEKVIKAPKE